MKVYRLDTFYFTQTHGFENRVWPVGKTQNLFRSWNSYVTDDEWRRRRSLRLEKTYLKDEKYLEQLSKELEEWTSYLMGKKKGKWVVIKNYGRHT